MSKEMSGSGSFPAPYQHTVHAYLREIDRLVRTNLLGSIYTCRAVSKTMIRQSQGAKTTGVWEAKGLGLSEGLMTGWIINVGSVVGTQGNAGQAVYSATKSGMEGWWWSYCSCCVGSRSRE